MIDYVKARATENYRVIKAYLTNMRQRDFTLDLDHCNKRKAVKIASIIATNFNVKVRVFRTRRGKYHIEACFPHSLLDNILLRLLCNDDLARLQFDVTRMACFQDTHNVLFDKMHKLTIANWKFIDSKDVAKKLRNKRKPLTVVSP